MKWISMSGLLLIIVTTNAFSTSLEVAFLGYSNHYVDREYDYNENHQLIGVSINNGFSVAQFVNSYHNKSTLVGWKFQMEDGIKIYDRSIHLGAIAGVVTGYEQDQIITYINDDISLYLIPQLIFTYPITDTIALSVVNGIVPDSKGVIFMHHLQLSFNDLF